MGCLPRARADVPFGLALGPLHGCVPPGGPADSRAAPAALGGEEQFVGVDNGRSLLGFEHEAAAFVEVDAADGGVAVAVVHGDAAFEHVGVVAVVGAGGGEKKVIPLNCPSMIEAMVGAFYMAVMIARLVALHSSKRPQG